ncbi:MAG: GAF domain-containing protein [Aggregatilineales bacterium]
MAKILTAHLQTKLILAFLLVLLIPTVAVGVTAVTTQTNNLRDQARENELAANQAIGTGISALFNRIIPDAQYLSNTRSAQDYAQAVVSNQPDALKAALGNLSKAYLAYLTYAGIYSQIRLLDRLDHEVVHVDYNNGQPVIVWPTQTLDLSDSDLFHQTFILPKGSVFSDRMTLKAVQGITVIPYQPIIRIATSIYAPDNKEAVGIVVLSLNAQPILDAVKGDNPSQTAYLIDSAGTYLAGPDPNKLFGPQLHPDTSFFADRPEEAVTILAGDDGTWFGSPEAPDVFQSFTHIHPAGLQGIRWTLYRTEPISVVLDPVNVVRLEIVALTGFFLLIAVGIALLITRTIVRPVQQLARAASAISYGRWDAPLPIVTSNDEIDALSAAFAAMSRELKAVYTSLEDRVRARTSELEMVAKVSAAAASILSLDELLQTIVDQTARGFNLYAVSIFQYIPETRKLKLTASSFDKDAGIDLYYSVDSEKGLLAKSGRTRSAVLSNDVEHDPLYVIGLNRPDTRAELALPMIVGERLLGLLDCESDQVNHFSPDSVPVMTSLAEQIAIALNNATLFAESERARQRAELITAVNSQLTQATDEHSILSALVPLVEKYGIGRISLSYFHFGANDQPVGFDIVAVQEAGGEVIPLTSLPFTHAPLKANPLIEYVLQPENELVLSEAVETDPRWLEAQRDYFHHVAIGALIVVPLKTGNRWQGLLTLAWPSPQSFDSEIRILLPMLKPRLADSVARRRAHLAAEAARRETETLYRMGKAMNLATSFVDIIEAVGSGLPDLSLAISLGIFEYYDVEKASHLRIVAARPAHTAVAVATDIRFPRESFLFSVPGEQTVIEDVYQSTDPILIENLEKVNTVAVLSAPIFFGDRSVGVLVLSSPVPRKFSGYEQRIVLGAAELIAGGLERSRLFDEQRQAAEMIREARRETEMLYRISRLINETTTYPQILDAYAAEAGPFDYQVGLSLYENYNFDQASSVDTVAVLRPGQMQAMPVAFHIPIGCLQFDAQDMIVIEDMAGPVPIDADSATYYRSTGVMAILAANFSLRGQKIGVITFSGRTPRRFSDLERRTIRGLGELTAAAVERSRLYAEQVKTAQSLREVDNLKSQFLASMSHELRTPLNAILNFTEFVALGMLGTVNDQQRDALTKAISSGRHLLALINDVLDITKIEAGMMTLFIKENIDLYTELASVVAAARSLLADKPVTFIQDIDSELPLMLGDRRRIRQILLNLLSNATKFTEKGSVTLSARHQGNQILFVVKDTGPGIALKDQASIFEPFVQAGSGVRHAGGTGLGLPISRQLAEAHGGKLWVESEPGKGAAFYVLLPVRSAALS